MERFHTAHPDVVLQINVTRWPYSFIGDDRSGRSSLAGSANGVELKETWHDALLGYMGNDPAKRDGAERSMAAQGRAAGIAFDYNVLAQWQPFVFIVVTVLVALLTRNLSHEPEQKQHLQVTYT